MLGISICKRDYNSLGAIPYWFYTGFRFIIAILWPTIVLGPLLCLSIPMRVCADGHSTKIAVYFRYRSGNNDAVCENYLDKYRGTNTDSEWSCGFEEKKNGGAMNLYGS